MPTTMTTQTRKTTRPKTVKKPSTPSVKSIIDSLSDPDNPLIISIANALKKKNISNAKKYELEPHLARIRKLTHEVHEKEQIITQLEENVDNIEQYMKRDCLTVTGIRDREWLNENTNQLIIDMAKSKLNVELTPKLEISAVLTANQEVHRAPTRLTAAPRVP